MKGALMFLALAVAGFFPAAASAQVGKLLREGHHQTLGQTGPRGRGRGGRAIGQAADAARPAGKPRKTRRQPSRRPMRLRRWPSSFGGTRGANEVMVLVAKRFRWSARLSAAASAKAVHVE